MYSYIDLAGYWHTKWRGPEHPLVGREDTHTWGVPDDEWTIGWLAFVQSVPEDTWFCLI
jgi:hypothetical protein